MFLQILLAVVIASNVNGGMRKSRTKDFKDIITQAFRHGRAFEKIPDAKSLLKHGQRETWSEKRELYPSTLEDVLSRKTFEKTRNAKSMSNHLNKDLMSSRKTLEKTRNAKSMSNHVHKDVMSSRKTFEKTRTERNPIPAGWTCSESWYNALDGCDCHCGAWDPDCDIAGQTLYGCDGICTNEGNMPVCVVSIPPADWTCSESYYAASDGCDCNCGAWDPDCDIAGQTLYGCPSQEYTCAQSWDPICVPDEWTCSLSYYDALDGCDCECGVWDPDCDVEGQPLFGCSSGDTCSNNGVEGICQSPLPTLPSCNNTAAYCANWFENEGRFDERGWVSADGTLGRTCINGSVYWFMVSTSGRVYNSNSNTPC